LYQLIASLDDFIVVNKSPGVSFHNETGDGLIRQLSLDFDQQFYPVHRLDKATSGLLLVAKNQTSCRELTRLFEERLIEKYYLAISDKKPSKKQGLIKGDMQRSRNGCWKLSKQTTNPAITQFFSFNVGVKRRLFLLKPHTGKTHQLRVVMKSIGAPILGDTRYGSATLSDNPWGNNRMYLHAYYLDFDFSGERFCFSVLPEGKEFNSTVIEFIQENIAEPSALSWPKIK
jgi:tRNA pseudouridine32 synthase/23S rRNA pseudouridine746 synthase